MEAILNDIWNYYQRLEFSYQFVSGLIAFLIATSFILLIFILLSRTYKNYLEKKEKALKATYEDILTKILFDEEYAKETENYNRTVTGLKRRRFTNLSRYVITTLIVDLHKNLRGESAELLEQFYRDLNLHKKGEKVLRSGPWHYQAYVMREYAELKITEMLELVLKFTDHKHDTLRSEAQISAVSLGGVGALSFIDDAKKPLSEWQQLSILEILKKIHRDDIPRFTRWLDSNNNSVIVFATKLISYFRQFDAAQDMVKLLDHDNDKVKIAAMQSFVKLEKNDFKEEMKSRFNDYSVVVQTEVLTSLETLGNESDIEFVEKAYIDATDYEVIFHSAKCIKEIEGREKLEEIRKGKGAYKFAIAEHILDERI